MYDPCYCVCNICLFMYLLGDGIDIDIVKLRTEHLMIQSTDNRERAAYDCQIRQSATCFFSAVNVFHSLMDNLIGQ